MKKKVYEDSVPVNNAGGNVSGVSNDDPSYPLAKKLGGKKMWTRNSLTALIIKKHQSKREGKNDDR